MNLDDLEAVCKSHARVTLDAKMVLRLLHVHRAAKRWRAHRERNVDAHGEPRSMSGVALIDAVDAAEL